ncbi:MAG: haloacid dehalogenase-like hydrolase [Clostridia bacterium]|nr:haloacid dehalogenase-like hydrolase [Clostridia bacterium]
MKRILAVLTALVMALMLCVPATAEEEDRFADWNPDAPALKALIEYVESVTDESSPDYIPPVDRIATFDMDGTLCAELNPTYLEYYLLAWRILKDPSYEPDAEMLEFGRMLRDHALDKSFPDHMDMLHATHAAKAYAGMTLTQFQDFVTNRLVQEADGFEGMTYANTFYTPMIEVVEYLQENGFKVFVCSGSDRFLCRTYIEGVLDIPYEQIIGMDVAVEATNQGDTDGLEYVYTSEDNIIRTDKLLIKNLKMNKVAQIVKEIGRQPVLSFGNSGGDVSMHNYTIFNNRYKSAAFMLIADNEELDYGSAEKVQPLKEKWEASGYHVISMRDDFRTIYGDEVKKTGTFHWLEDLAEERVPAEEPAAEEAADSDVQYVLYLGTNDKDTNTPVFTQEEAMEQARAILLRNFGGYTIQEAHGGWIDEGKEYQEYTLVISLSDTTPEKVHAAADELISVFRQSSVLIQENPTKTEFYAGK